MRRGRSRARRQGRVNVLCSLIYASLNPQFRHQVVPRKPSARAAKAAKAPPASTITAPVSKKVVTKKAVAAPAKKATKPALKKKAAAPKKKSAAVAGTFFKGAREEREGESGRMAR